MFLFFRRKNRCQFFPRKTRRISLENNNHHTPSSHFDFFHQEEVVHLYDMPQKKEASSLHDEVQKGHIRVIHG